MKKPPVRVHHMMLSQWQSVVYKTVHQLFADKPQLCERILDANDAFVRAAASTPRYPYSQPILRDRKPVREATFDSMSKEQLSAFLEFAFFHAGFVASKKKTPPQAEGGAEMKEASPPTTVLAQAPVDITYVSDDYKTFNDAELERPYSDEMVMQFIESSLGNYVWSYYRHPSGKKYNSWEKEGNNHQSYGVIDWQIPKNGKVAVIGDWGTGMDDAKALLADIVTNHKPDCIIHLGDIYYAGESSECSANFTDVITAVFNENNGGTRIPVFTIPGNHEYYSYGYPYFSILPGLNSQHSNMLQEASYFCLTVQDTNWQFLAMDTGYDDADPLNSINTFDQGPELRASEVEWHQDKLSNVDITTILLSHHQLFSANAKINGSAEASGNKAYQNSSLYKNFQPYFADRVAAWLWGHEHNMAIYQNGLLGLAKGRLIGSSAYQETMDEDPYTVNCSDYPYLEVNGGIIQLKTNEEYTGTTSYDMWGNLQETITYRTYYDHSYMILDFANCNSANDSVLVSYYDYPSWWQQTLYTPGSSLLYQENFSRPSNTPQETLQYSNELILKTGTRFIGALDGSYVARTDNYSQNFSIVSATGKSGTVCDSDKVYLVNTSPLIGNNNKLRTNGHDSTDYLTYANDSGDSCTWYIKKKNGNSGDFIHYGDEVHFVSKKEDSYYLYNDSTKQLNLDSSNYLSFIVSIAATLPNENPIGYGSNNVVLQIAHNNEWYYLSNAESSGSSWNAKLISESDVVSGHGAGIVPSNTFNRTVREDSVISYDDVTITLPASMKHGDIFSLVSTESLNTSESMFFGSQTTSGKKVSYMPQTDSVLSQIELIVAKMDRSVDDIIRENDLLQIHCVVNGTTLYLTAGTSNQNMYASTSGTATYCRLSYKDSM